MAGPSQALPPADPLIVLDGPLTRTDIPALCDRLEELLQQCHEKPVVCDAHGLHTVDVVVVEALARLQLTARRHGSRVRLRRPSAELLSLLDLVGLRAVLVGES